MSLRRHWVTISFGNFSATHHPSRRRATGCAADLLLPRRDRDEMVTNFIHKEKERRIQLQSTLPNLIYKRQDSISTVSTKLGPFASFSSKMFSAR